MCRQSSSVGSLSVTSLEAHGESDLPFAGIAMCNIRREMGEVRESDLGEADKPLQPAGAVEV